MMQFMQNLYNKPSTISSSLPSNTIPNPEGEAKAITTRSGMSYKVPPIPPTGVNQQETVEATTDTEPQNSDDILPPTVQAEVQVDKPADEPVIVIPKANPNLPYPSRIQKEKNQEKDDILAAKLIELTKTPLNENCSAVALKKLPEKLGDPEVIPDTMCDVHFINNPTPLEAKDHVEIVINFNDDISSSDDDSLHEENIEYVEASLHDSELVSLKAAEIVILEVEEIKDDNLREKLLNVHLLIANIETLKDNPTQSSELLTKSSSTSLNSFLEETNTFHNSFPEFEDFYFDLGEISSGSTTTHSNISLPDYEAFSFDDDHIKEISSGKFENFYFDLGEISSGSTTTHSDISLLDYEAFSFNNDHIREIISGSTTTHSDISLSEYDSFIFDLTHEEFVDELAHIISPPEYDCFYFRDLPDPGELMSVLNSRIRENLSTTSVSLPIEDDHSPLFAYVVWIFVAYLTYPVIPPYLHPFGNEDIIFDSGITINHFYSPKPGSSHRHGAFKKFNTHRSHLNE
nr:hypothetical protein [Tanacetum cinerariifolium]